MLWLIAGVVSVVAVGMVAAQMVAAGRDRRNQEQYRREAEARLARRADAEWRLAYMSAGYRPTRN
jgi:hypothetical protein